tara:strand:- start:1624 stop:1998 length:375 start_codon:yes stop_codon:yes gene_type:complete
MDKYMSLLPDDLILKIYSNIYYPQNSKLLSEIKLFHYIKNNLVNNFGLYNVCCCSYIHSKHDSGITSFTLNEIDDIIVDIYNLNFGEKNKLLNNLIGKMSLKYKNSLILDMRADKDDLDINHPS